MYTKLSDNNSSDMSDINREEESVTKEENKDENKEENLSIELIKNTTTLVQQIVSFR